MQGMMTQLRVSSCVYMDEKTIPRAVPRLLEQYKSLEELIKVRDTADDSMLLQITPPSSALLMQHTSAVQREGARWHALQSWSGLCLT